MDRRNNPSAFAKLRDISETAPATADDISMRNHSLSQDPQNINETAPPTAEDINERIQALPQGLQDHILDFTLIPHSKVIAIDETYKPPWQLAVNRRTGEVVAEAYYGGSTFISQVLENPKRQASELRSDVLHKWLSSLCPKHKRKIVSIRFDLEQDAYSRLIWGGNVTARNARLLTIAAASRVLERMQVWHGDLAAGVISVRCRYIKVKGVWEEATFTDQMEPVKAFDKLPLI
ncbi:hypothetical protein M409DRAFT_31040 [Zasmidium cellare ATCC 36951]|uniref:Uncharacterized protein n=1 Tax=Zasmidium cellare ATCC 36951 TaxID=1080233 RepID=A0A6A6BY28_ZASCE|nr:uncharacterized protein M409DRAFT_31040 [Zasmidium cellare ATCC 36951]KAF2158462.1 hypothetical protein M409DRAFT_31040 [Zasmidium cellare ATCC 36951]